MVALLNPLDFKDFWWVWQNSNLRPHPYQGQGFKHETLINQGSRVKVCILLCIFL